MQWPPKHPKNGTREAWGFPSSDPWPGDLYKTLTGDVYVYSSDGSGWHLKGKG